MIKKHLFKLGIICTSIVSFSAIASAPGAGTQTALATPYKSQKPNWKPKHLAYSFSNDDNIPTAPKHWFHKGNMHRIKFNTKMKTSIKSSRWVDNDLPFPYPNIKNKQLVMYEDSRGNLWATSWGKGLHKYNYANSKWILDRTSNITNGGEGIIFEDSRGNLWSMGNTTPLQKYDYEKKRWNKDTSSNINDGYRGVLYEDSQGRLWAIGIKKALQKYNYNTNKWVTETNGNKIKDHGIYFKLRSNYSAIIYEDSYGNIWIARYGNRLQKLEYKKSTWTRVPIYGNDFYTAITDYLGAYLFEDSYDRLWYIRGNINSGKNGYTIHYYDYKKKIWNKRNYFFNHWKNTGASNEYNQSVIFESSLHRKLFMMANKTSILNFNEYIATKYRAPHDTKEKIKKKPKLQGAWRKHWYLLEKSGITNGNYGKIWEDQWQNIWFTAENSKLTSMRSYADQYVTDDIWTLERDYKFNDWATKNKNKITNGKNGVLFQDSRGNLWSMGHDSPLQKLVPQAISNKDNWETKKLRGWFMTHLLPDSKISVWISGYLKYTSNKYTHLRYRKIGETAWKIVKNKKLILANGDYEFKWEIGTDEELGWFKKYEGSEQTKPSRWYVKNNGKIEEKLSLYDLARFPQVMDKPTKKVMSYVNNGQKPQAKDLNHPQRIGYNFKFKLATPINEKGESIVTYAVNTTKNPEVVKYISFIVGGFEKKDDVSFRQSFENLKPSAISVKPTKITNFKSGQKVLKNLVTLPYHYGYKFTFKSATTADSSNNSKVTYYISSIVKLGLKKEMTFLVAATESSNARELRELNASSITSPPKKLSANVNNGEKPQASAFTLPMHNGYSFTFKKASLVDEDGKSQVTYEIFKTSEANIKKVMTFAVGGFETNAAKIKRVAKQELLSLRPEEITEKPQASRSYSLNQGEKPKYHHFFHPKHSGYMFQFEAASGVVANDEGVLPTATYFVRSIKEGLETKRKITFTNISGFVTKKESNLKLLAAKNVAIQPTKIGGSTPAQITSSSVNSPHHLGYTFTFKSGEKLASNANTWKVTYVVKDASDEDLKKELIFNVVNKETTTARKLRELDTSLITSPTKKPGASVKFDHSPIATDFVAPTFSGYTFNFMGATKVDVTGTTKVSYEIFKDTNRNIKKTITFAVGGFETQADAIKRVALENLNQLTSDNVVTKPTKKISSNAYFGQKPTQVDINKPIHQGMVFTFKSATKINEWGSSDVTYSVKSLTPGVTKTKDVTFKNVYGFTNKWAISLEKVDPNNIAKVKTFLSTLSNETISSLSTVTKHEVLKLIQAASGYSGLTNVQQALITKDLILLSIDFPKTLKVTITFKGETYELVKDDFKKTLTKLTLEIEANKFQDFISNDTTKSKAASLKASSKNVLNIFKEISGYQRPANLASDIAITEVIVKNALNLQTRKMTFELTISRQGEEPIKKDINVTFKALKVIPKPSKKEANKKDSSGLSAGAIVGISLGSIFGIGIISFLIFYLVRRNKK